MAIVCKFISDKVTSILTKEGRFEPNVTCVHASRLPNMDFGGLECFRVYVKRDSSSNSSDSVEQLESIKGNKRKAIKTFLALLISDEAISNNKTFYFWQTKIP